MTAEAAIDFDRTYTLEEFLSLDLPGEDDGTLSYELVGGKLVAKDKLGVSAEHGKVLFKLSTSLGAYLASNPIGQGFADAPTTLGSTDPKASRVDPDICFVQNGRIPDRFKGPIPVAPDLVVEIWSPSDTTEKIQDKIEVYQAAGVRLIWSTYMLSRFIVVYQGKGADRKFLDLDGELNGEDVLPGFRLAVKTLFE